MTASDRLIRSVFAAKSEHSRLFRFAIAALFFVFPLLSTPVAAQNTTITGTVYDPAGALPLPNVLVYVTTGSVVPLTPGAQCMTTPTTPTPTPMDSYTYTAVDGSFTLLNVPENTIYTLVIQAGKWRRQFSETVGDGALNGLTLTMPSTHSPQDDIPLIAIATGQGDAMECMLRHMGIADSEFTDDNDTTSGGRIHLYKGSESPGAEISANTPSETALMDAANTLNGYDMVMFPCQGSPNGQATQTAATNLLNYANAGGRVFATHHSYVWLDPVSPYDSQFPPVANWDPNQAEPTPDPGIATVNTSFTDGATLAQWLQNAGATYQGSTDEIQISSLRQDFNGVNLPAQSWLTLNDATAENPVMQFTFDTLVGPTANQCGRVLYSDYHVIQASSPSGTPFPIECPSSTAMTPQEEILEYALFDQPTYVTPQPIINWPTPAPITYGTPLSGAQLDASATGMAGVDLTSMLAYTPPSGTVLPAGPQTLSVSFPPVGTTYTWDGTTYTSATASVPLTVNLATATVTLGNLNQTYTGLPLSATATTTPIGLAVNITYNGSPTPPTAAGTYPVVATINDLNYQGSATGTLIISKAAATVTLGNLAQTYTGSPLSATATTTPIGLAVNITYNGSPTPPTAAGTYPVVATINDLNYQGSATGTMTINKAAATVTLTGLTQTYTGSPLSATATTTPIGLAVNITYNGSPTPPTAAGTYPVVGTINDLNYQGSATGTMTINKATPTVTWAAPAAITYGTPLSATQLDATSPVQGSFTYLPGPGTVLIVGPHTLTATFSPTDTPDYTTSMATVSLTVIQPTPHVALTASANPVFTSNPITFTAILTVPATSTTAPTGTVTFLDGPTPLGTGVVTASVATLTVSAPATGNHSITAVYSGDTNYLSAASLPLPETIQDFTIVPPAVATVPVPFGGQATYQFGINSLGGDLPAAVNLTLTGLPPGMTAVFSTDVVPAGLSTANVTLQVSLPGYSAQQAPPGPFGGRSLPLALGLILLPFAGRLRKTAHRFRRVAVLTLAGAALAVGVTGCQITFTPKTYPLTVTATSGTLSHTTTVNIIVE